MEETDAVDDVVDEVADDGTFGVDVGDEEEDDMGDDADKAVVLISSSALAACRRFVMATDTDGGDDRISSKLRVCGSKIAFFVGLIRWCKTGRLVLMHRLCCSSSCEGCGKGRRVVESLLLAVVTVLLLLVA